MGLFDQLGVTADDLPETGFTNPKDGYYNFEISEIEKRNGTKKDPNCTKLTIEYDLDEHGKTMEWFHLADDGEVTEKARKSLGFLRDRLVSLGADPATFDPDDGDLIGIRGSLQLVTRNGFQNIRNLSLDEVGGSEEDPSDYDDGSAKQDAALKAKVAANRAARAAEDPAPAKRAPVKRTPKAAPAAADEDNPFEGM